MLHQKNAALVSCLLLFCISFMLAAANGTAASRTKPPAGFVPTGSMTIAREDFSATLLPSGMVLVVDGDGSIGSPSPAELYNPATGTFAFTGTPSTKRYSYTATLLSNGKVLIAGGYNSTGALA